jgi:nucleoside-diphosphate-sugar epimerase
MARTALVTGATGLVGSHIVDRLLRDGWNVRALVRSTAQELEARGVETRTGDILNGESFASASVGCDVIFHTAALITQAGSWETYRRTNVDGTENAIAAAERAGARLLQLSSVAVYGATGRFRTDDSGASVKTDETTPLGPLPEGSFYARSKRESEALVLAAHDAGRIWATAVRPDVIYGTRDRQFVPRIARTLRFGFAPVIGGGRSILPIVHAANVADGAVAAVMSDGAGGRTYNLANDYDVSVREFFLMAGEGLSKRVRLIPISRSIAERSVGIVMGILKVATGGSLNVVSSSSLSFLTRDNPFTSDRARRELGWSPHVRPERGVPEAFRWWAEQRRH